ncbi:MAG: penicillin-binding protein activator [Pseudomonadota bacterium]
MLRASRFRLAAIFLGGSLAVSGCTPTVTTQGPPAPGQGGQSPTAAVEREFAADQQVTVALLAPSSAPRAAAVGKALVNAARMAMSERADPLLQLRVYDTGGNVTQARLAAEKAISDGAMVILGPLFGANAKAVAEPAATAGVKVLSFSTDASAAGDPVYLTGFLPEVAAERIANFARARGMGSIGVFYPNNPYGAAANTGVGRAVGTNVVARAEYQRTNDGITQGTRAFAADARASGATAVLIADSGQALKYVAALMENYGISPRQVKYLGLGEWNSRATLTEPALQGGWFAAPDPTAVRAFVERYEANFGSVPPLQAVLAYDAVNIVAVLTAEARVSGAPPFSTEALTRGRGFKGAVGPVALGSDGIARRGMAILEVGEGVFTVVDPVPVGVGS